MGVDGQTLAGWLAGYDPASITIGVVASHSSLQILHGARMEGFRTLGIAVGEERRRFYAAFPGADPDEWLMLDDYQQLMDKAAWLRERNVIIVPHGSLVEYLGSDNFRELQVPTFGNRGILHWESSRERQRHWLEDGGCTMPRVVHDPKDIDGPVIVKYAGAKGGRGYFIARDSVETSTSKKNSPSRSTSSAAGITSISSLTQPLKAASKCRVEVDTRASPSAGLNCSRWTDGMNRTWTNSTNSGR